MISLNKSNNSFYKKLRIKINKYDKDNYVLNTELTKSKISEKNLNKHFIFYGFVPDDEKVYNILSHCLAGLATWTGDQGDNSLYADPGKPKLYALLGLPIIITSAPYVSRLIAETGAGERINYNLDDFIWAVKKIITTKEGFNQYRQGLERFRPYCLAEKNFNRAFSES